MSPMFVLLKYGGLDLNTLKGMVPCGKVKYSVELALAPFESNASFERMFSVMDAV